jgi:ribonucleoside-diphosphate reductase alpha chain
MKIIKRNGKEESLSFDKILIRLRKLCRDNGLEQINSIDIDVVAQKVIEQIYDGISSSEIDDLAANISISMSIEEPHYADLASRIAVSNIQKNTPNTFNKAMEILHKAGIVNESYYKTCLKYRKEIQGELEHNRDYKFDYFGIKTLERSYLLKKDKVIIERPQYMYMRVAVALYPDNIDSILECYDGLSRKLFTHASPTLFNAGTMRQQCSSCYLLSTEDSIGGIFKTITDCAHISKHAGGIGISVSNIRAKDSKIRTTNGHSDGIVPMLKVYNETARYVNQSSKRNGSFAMYLEPHHADIFDFLDMKKNTGDVNLRARDLLYALWIPDLFMKKVENDEDWYLMCPDESKGLDEVYGNEYEKLYMDYVSKGIYRKKIKARELWNSILVAQIETGTPYICYKDSVNKKSNQKHLGVIKSSNLCAEICLYNTPDSTAVCNIATISLPKFIEVKNGHKVYNYDKLGEITRLLVRNLNKVIDINYYPTPETEHNNKEHRPIAIGVQGLYNVFMEMRYPFDSPDAKHLNKNIFECIQYYAIMESCDMSIEFGPYNSYTGSPISKGIFQHNMWGIDKDAEENLCLSWDTLRQKVMKHGVRNSLLTALPPTASTSQILGNVESFEVLTSNFYMRRVLSGNYPIINRYLINDLMHLKLWNSSIKKQIITNDGSIQGIKEIPQELKNLYKTTWEVSQKTTISLAADRAPFIDHSQSLNIFIAAPTVAKLSSMHFYGWKSGLKTGMYYLRSLAASSAEKFSVDTQMKELVCSIDNREACESCSG